MDKMETINEQEEIELQVSNHNGTSVRSADSVPDSSTQQNASDKDSIPSVAPHSHGTHVHFSLDTDTTSTSGKTESVECTVMQEDEPQDARPELNDTALAPDTSVAVQQVAIEQQEHQLQDQPQKSESQPQPQLPQQSTSCSPSVSPKQQHRMLTPPLAINITDEYGHPTGSIDIDPNNNYELANQQPQQLTEQEKNAAVLVKNVSFAYAKRKDILSDITLTVPKGQIYALLGSSGCGKTTLLRIILGRIRPRKGIIRVSGAAPGSPQSNIPGSGVGYMPQELALFAHFTIEETLYYFGMLHHMSKEEVRHKTEFFVELLNLPPKDRQVCQCSGGQQRRTSMAATLFHDPPLLILDEPTVGVDPLLRCKIWQYLEYLCLTKEMTVIITTHYIEESRNAGNLAFMRFGRILTQDTPNNLLQMYECTILEDVFLKLCQQDCGEIKQKYSRKRKNRIKPPAIYEEEKKAVRSKLHSVSVDWIHLRALFFKNVINLKRNPMVVFFFLVLPVIQIVLFCYSVFKMPDNLAISVYNGESKGLSKNFLNTLDTNMLDVKYYSSPQEAIQTVADGKAWYAVSIGSNFTRAYRRRAKNPSDLSEEMFEASKIKMYVDHSDSFMLLTIYNSLIYSYQMFVEGVAESFGFHRETVRLPIYTKEVVYGKYFPGAGYDILNNLTPGALVAIIYTTPLIMAAFVVVLERKDGIMERTFVSGATSNEVFITHLVLLLLGLFIQVTLLMGVAFIVFELRLLGSLLEVFLMLYLQGLVGVMIGLLISSAAKNEVIALLVALFMVFPVWMMCGVFWPLESLIAWIQKIFWCMPLSLPIRSIEHIVKRGWTVQHAEVQLGYLVSLGYSSVLLVANVIIFHITSK